MMLMLGMVVVSSVTENVGIGECFNLTSLVCSLVDRYIGDYGYWLRREHSPDRNDDDDDDGGPSGKEKSAKIIRSLLAGWLADCVRCQCLWLYQLVLGLLKIMIFVPYSGYYYTGCRVYDWSYVREILRVGKGQGQWTGIPAPGWTVDTIQLTTTTCGDCFPSAVLRRKR